MPNQKTSNNNHLSKQLDIDELADELVEVIDSPATMTKEEMSEYEVVFKAQTWVVTTALGIQTMTGRELCERLKDDRDFAIAMAKWSRTVGAYLDKAEVLSKIMVDSQARVIVALAHRDDVEQIMEEAAKD